MATVKIASSFSTFVADQADTTYILDEGKALSVSGLYAIDARTGADNQTYRINGSITQSSEGGLAVGTFNGATAGADNAIITIGTTGRINVGDTAVGVYGDNVAINNDGVLSGNTKIESNGIYLVGDSANIVNDGLISAHYGIVVTGNAGTITNTGDIVSFDVITSGTETGETLRIVNTGRLVSTSFRAILGDDGKETVVNSGQIHGDAYLDGGDDIFISRGGHMDGTVHGGLGDDTFIVDNKLAQLSEQAGEGFDRIRSSVSWTLGDHFEEAMLTGKKNINLTGNDGGSMLYGNAGDNKITGDLGTDYLTGGRGDDTLTGGDGSVSGDIMDLFIFKNHSGKDMITDFQDGIDKISLSSYKGIESFADLSGHIKQAGEDVLITLHDGDRITMHGMDKADLSELDFQF